MNQVKHSTRVRHEARLARLLLLAAIWPALAAAETAVLRNGQRLRITGFERDGDWVKLQLPGGYVRVRSEELAAIEPEDFLSARTAPRMPTEPFEEQIRAASEKHGLDAHLISSVIAAESNFDPRAVSHKGALGLMQLMPATATRFGVRDALDPQANIDAGSRYLKELLARFEDRLDHALAAYNAGPERVEQHRGIPPFPETQAYVQRVLKELDTRRKNGGAPPQRGPASAP